MPSFILIRPAVWPQYTNVTDRQTGQTDRRDRQTDRQRTDSIGRTVWQTVARKRAVNIKCVGPNRSWRDSEKSKFKYEHIFNKQQNSMRILFYKMFQICIFLFRISDNWILPMDDTGGRRPEDLMLYSPDEFSNYVMPTPRIFTDQFSGLVRYSNRSCVNVSVCLEIFWTRWLWTWTLVHWFILTQSRSVGKVEVHGYRMKNVPISATDHVARWHFMEVAFDLTYF